MKTTARTTTRMFLVALVTFGLAGVASAKPASVPGKGIAAQRTPVKAARPTPPIAIGKARFTPRVAPRIAPRPTASKDVKHAKDGRDHDGPGKARWEARKTERQAAFAKMSPAERAGHQAKRQARRADRRAAFARMTPAERAAHQAKRHDHDGRDLRDGRKGDRDGRKGPTANQR